MLDMTLVKAIILLSPLQLLEKYKATISKIHSYVDYKAFVFGRVKWRINMLMMAN